MDRSSATKSAPATGRKSSEKKMSSLREIEIWVNEGKKEVNSRTSARNVGHLTENVTEDIMLYARQCELGRERYKFLVNHAYERQKFIEHQNKKERSMKKQMQAARRSIAKITPLSEAKRRSLTVRVPRVFQMEMPAEEVEETVEEPTEEAVSDPKPSDAMSTKSAKEINIVLNASAEKEIHLPKAISLDKRRIKTTTYVRTGLKSSIKSSMQSNRSADRLPEVKPAVCKGVSFGDRPESIMSVKSENNRNPSVLGLTDRHLPKTSECLEKTSATPRPQSRSSAKVAADRTITPIECSTPVNMLMPRMSIVASPDGLINTWASKSPYARMRTYGQRFVSSVDDPRYLALQSTLIPHISVERKKQEVVTDIIARKDALRGRSSRETDYRKRVHSKFIAQILQRELSATM